MVLKQLREHADLGLLIARLGVGLSFVFIHGWGKIFGGPERWEGLGGMFGGIIGIEFLPIFFGFLAAISEFIGGILIALGLLFRPACIALAITMLFATLAHPIVIGDAWASSSTFHPLKMFFVFVGFTFVGPGEYSIDGGDMLD